MKERKIRVKILVPHRIDCSAVADKCWDHPWAYFIDEAVYLDAIGRKTRGGGRRWIVARCNSDCPAQVAVCEDDLLREVQAVLSKEQK